MDTRANARRLARDRQQATAHEDEQRVTGRLHFDRVYPLAHQVPAGCRATGRAIAYGLIEVRLTTRRGAFAAYGVTDLHALRRVLQEAQASAGSSR